MHSRTQLIIILLVSSIFTSSCQKAHNLIDKLTPADSKNAESASETTESSQPSKAEATLPTTRLPNIKTRLKFPDQGKVWFVKGNGLEEIEPSQSFVSASMGNAFKQAFLMSFHTRFAVILSGKKAFMEISDNHPVFYTRVSPSSIAIARLKIDQEKSRRLVWMTVKTGSNMGNIDPESDDIGFDYAKTSAGTYKVILRREIPNGEYTLLTAANGGKAFETYAFSVAGRGITSSRDQAPSPESGYGNLVSEIQKELKARGYYKSTVDGLYGRGTRAAISAYQRDKNIADDGKPTIALLKTIRGQ